MARAILTHLFGLDLWRTRRRAGHVQLICQLCDLVLGAALHQHRGLRVDLLLLRHVRAGVDGGGDPARDVREAVEGVEGSAVLQVPGGGWRAD